MAGEFFASEKAGAEGGSGVAGDGLDEDIFEAAAKFEGADEKNIQENSTGEAEGIGGGGFTEILCERDDEFFEEVLRAAGNVRTKRRIERRTRLGKSGVSIKARREDAATVGAGSEIAAIENGKTFCVEGEESSKGFEEFGLAVFAEPLELVFIAIGAKAEVLREARIKPADGIRKCEIAERLDAVAIAERDGTGTSHGTFIEGEDESAIETGGVVGAGGMGQVVIETKNVAATREQLTKLPE